MDYRFLPHINSPKDLRALPVSDLPALCDEIRDYIVLTLASHPGHLGASLGTVEITVALHYVFDTPCDKILFDVGHQSYTHKLLTGRRDAFPTLRQLHGLVPFMSPAESEYDAFIAGHASNSISAALGLQLAAQKAGKNEHVVALIGDGAMTGGLAFEGLNNVGAVPNNLLIILNDNHCAIDPIRGGLSQYLLDITTSSFYNRMRYRGAQLLRRLHLLNSNQQQRIQRFNNHIKTSLSHQPNNIFSSLNMRYFGPADGHNVVELVRILHEIRDYTGPRVLHIITQKGHGYAPAEQDPTVWHAPGTYDPATGQRTEAHSLLWQEVFGQTLLQLAKANDRIVGITPAMPSGCSMSILQAACPDRVFDVGIAEGHAVTFAAGLAAGGLVPYCNVYSSFLQRSYDNIIHDVALPNLPVVLCIDRAGIVGADGATHHGLFDLAYLRPIPNLLLAAPRTGQELRNLLFEAQFQKRPFAIRYPRGKCPDWVALDAPMERVEIGKGACLQPLKNSASPVRIAVLSLGAIGNAVQEAVAGLNVAHYAMLWLSPLDKSILQTVAQQFTLVLTVEDGTTEGGLGSAVAEFMAAQKNPLPVVRLGVEHQFVEHGTPAELYHLLGLDTEGIRRTVLNYLEPSASCESVPTKNTTI